MTPDAGATASQSPLFEDELRGRESFRTEAYSWMAAPQRELRITESERDALADAVEALRRLSARLGDRQLPAGGQFLEDARAALNRLDGAE